MATLYLLLGSNQQQPQKQLLRATKLVGKQIGPIIKCSAVYETAAWGNNNQPNFLNQVLKISTPLAPAKALAIALRIEAEMGRVRTVKNAPRIIDIDILFFDKQIIYTKDLKVPHPLLQDRRFVLVPLNEMSPNLKHPILNKSIHDLLKLCTDPLGVKKFCP